MVSDVYNQVVNVTDDTTLITDSVLQGILKRMSQGAFGEFEFTIKDAPNAATDTTIRLQLTDTANLLINTNNLSQTRFTVEYVDDRTSGSEFRFLWIQKQATDPGDGSVAIALDSSPDFAYRSIVIGGGAGQFSFKDDAVTTQIATANGATLDAGFRIFRNDNVAVTSTAVLQTISLVNGTYRWILSASGTTEYYVELAAGGDPGLNEPDSVLGNALTFTAGTIGSLAASEWVFGNNDSLGFQTVYVRLADGTDPDSKAVNFVTAIIPVTVVPRWVNPLEAPHNAVGDGTNDDNIELLSADTAAGVNGNTYIEQGKTYHIAAEAANPTLVSKFMFDAGGTIDVNSGVTATFNGPINEGLHQRFSGAGTIVLGSKIKDVYPEWFGAVGDDVADDTAEIQDAITSSPVGATVWFSGTYLISATITLKTGVHLRGTSGATIKLKDASHAGLDSTTAMLAGSSVSDITIENLTIDGNKANNTAGNTSKGDGIYFTGATNIVIENAQIKNCPRDGLTFLGATTQDVRISNCFIDGSGIAGMNGGENLLLIAGKNFTVSNSIFTNSLLRGIDVETTGGSTIVDVVISNCICNDNNRGMAVGGSTIVNVLITGCLFKSNTLDGLLLNNSSDVTVSGCQMISNSTDGLRLSQSSDDIVITGCKIESNTSNGISGRINRGLISNNLIQGNGAAGIDIDSAATELSINGNTIRNNTTVGVTFRVARGNMIGNIISDNGTIGINAIDSNYSVFKGNTVYSNGESGIAINRGRGIIVASNVVYLNNDDGIRFINTPTDSIIEGTTVLDNNQSGGAGFDNIEVTGTNCLIQNNVCRQGSEINKPLRGIHVESGTDNVVRNNDLASAGSSANFTDAGTRTIAYQNVGDDAVITQHLTGTVTWDPANIVDGGQESKNVIVTGASLGDVVAIGFSTSVPGGMSLSAAISAANTVTATLVNHTGGPLDLASGTLRATVWKY